MLTLPPMYATSRRGLLFLVTVLFLASAASASETCTEALGLVSLAVGYHQASPYAESGLVGWEIADLPPGTRLYVPVGVLSRIKGLGRLHSDGPGETVAVEVESIMGGSGAQVRHGAPLSVSVLLKVGAAGKTVEVYVDGLSRKVFATRPTSALRSGDWATLDITKLPVRSGKYCVLPIRDNPRKQRAQYRGLGPAGPGVSELDKIKSVPVVFLGENDRGQPIVEIRQGHGEPPLRAIVPLDALGQVPIGSPGKLAEIFRRFDGPPQDFEPNEAVRYRSTDGRLALGTIVARTQEGSWRIKPAHGHEITLEPSQVFRRVPIDGGIEPQTTHVFWTKKYRTDFQATETPEGLYADFLNLMGRLTSLPDFRGHSDVERFQFLTRFVSRLVRWHESGMAAEENGVRNFADMMCSGAAVCRHLAPMLTTVLRETGYDARTVVAPEGKDHAGHAWVEVVLEGGERWILDPSNGWVASESDIRPSSNLYGQLARTLPVFTRRAKRKMVAHPKFYFFDVGVFNALRPRGPLDSDSELMG